MSHCSMKVVTVNWFDVTKRMNDDDFDETQNIDGLFSSMKTIGCLYKETAKTLFIVQEFDNGVPRDWVVIPRGLVESVEGVDEV